VAGLELDLPDAIGASANVISKRNQGDRVVRLAVADDLEVGRFQHAARPRVTWAAAP
jgi:hypothetical protein